MRVHNFIKPKLILSEWLPMGINNLISLNRHLGSHKGYKASTAFGMKGSVIDLKEGVFEMKSKGSLMRSVDYQFSRYLKAEMISRTEDRKSKGIELDKDGACFVGLDLSESINTIEMKNLIGEVEADFADEFLGILTETQLSLLRSSYGIEDNNQLKNTLSTYALVISESIGIEIVSAEEFLKNSKTKNLITPVTDWIIDYFSYKDCYVFIGMKAMLCLGIPDKTLTQLLKNIMFIRTMFNVSLKLYSVMWKNMKSLDNMGKKIPSSNYNLLKKFNYNLASLHNSFSRQKIVCSQMTKTIESKLESFLSSAEPNTTYFKEIHQSFKDELEKSEDRMVITNQMTIDLQSLRDQLQQRISLIMTKSGQRLNLILLVLTVISVMSIGEILGFRNDMLILVLVIIIPFIIIAIKSYIQYRKDFEDDL
jgi:hypothetical protein